MIVCLLMERREANVPTFWNSAIESTVPVNVFLQTKTISDK